MKLSPKQIKEFQEKILEWYAKNQRDLPWRQTRNPYNILVSEVMSQQTQLSRVVPKYLAWMKQFPTIEILAEASTRDVLAMWSGLGYNRRALYLQKLAKTLVQKTQNTKVTGNSDNLTIRHADSPSFSSIPEAFWPDTEEELKKLPGIGEYTARALLCFAFNKQVAVVDTNVRKVILTQFSIFNFQFSKRTPTGTEVQEIADQLLPEGKAYEWNQALMDYASVVLKKEKIAIPKQSHFKTSNRFYRGQVIKLLLQAKKETIESLFEKIEHNGIAKESFEKIIKGMEKDGLLVLRQKDVKLS